MRATNSDLVQSKRKGQGILRERRCGVIEILRKRDDGFCHDERSVCDVRPSEILDDVGVSEAFDPLERILCHLFVWVPQQRRKTMSLCKAQQRRRERGQEMETNSDVLRAGVGAIELEDGDGAVIGLLGATREHLSRAAASWEWKGGGKGGRKRTLQTPECIDHTDAPKRLSRPMGSPTS